MDEDSGIGISTDLPFEQAVMRTRIAMRSRGFSILSEMPAPTRIGEGRQHLFMGLWEQLIAAGNLGGPMLDVGDHLPCNVVVFEEQGQTHIACLDPTEMAAGWAQAEEPAAKALAALHAMLEDVAGAAE